MVRKYAITLGVLLACGCSETSTPPAVDGGAQRQGAAADENVTRVTLSVPGMT